MVSISRNTFVKSYEVPASNPLRDGNQFSGEGLRLLKNQCPRPLASGTGESFCALTCRNSCPQLNPNDVANAAQQLSFLTAYKPHVQSSVSSAQTSLNTATALVSVTGDAFFDVPADASADVIVAVMDLIENELPKHVSYSVRPFVCCSDALPLLFNW